MHYALKDYGAELDWNIGSLFCHDEILLKTVDLCSEFKIPNPIKWAFGCIPSLLSSGMAISDVVTENVAEQVAISHIERGVACRLALTNPHADINCIHRDRDSLRLMSFLNSHSPDGIRNGVIVSSDALAMYVREAYPNLETILSSVRPAYDVGYGILNDTVEWYVEKLNTSLYDIVEVNNSKAYEEGFMESLPFREKVELIACRDCIRNCPYTKCHFESALGIMNQMRKENSFEKSRLMYDEVTKMCIANRRKHLDQASSYSPEEIKRLVSLGYRRFQISSRRNTDERIARDIGEYLFNYRHLRYLENLIV